MLLFLACIGCNSDELCDSKPNDVVPITSRTCPGDWTIVLLEKGKCKNDCTRGMSLRCGGTITWNRCGKLTLRLYYCGGGYIETGTFEIVPGIAAADTADAVRARIEYPDRYHARFVFLEDISDELVLDSDFTVTNNMRWEDDLGYTFGGNTFHYFQFIGGDYSIVVNTSYPYGSALVDVSSY